MNEISHNLQSGCQPCAIFDYWQFLMWQYMIFISSHSREKIRMRRVKFCISTLILACVQSRVLGRLGPGQLGPGQLGPGAQMYGGPTKLLPGIGQKCYFCGYKLESSITLIHMILSMRGPHLSTIKLRINLTNPSESRLLQVRYVMKSLLKSISSRKESFIVLNKANIQVHKYGGQCLHARATGWVFSF